MRIGLLEDDTNQIELISLWSKEAGDDLLFYTNGKSFRAAIDTEQFDLLVLDWHLPDTTGIKELDWLRNDRSMNIPVIFITSRDSEESVVEALDHGADDYMVKPVTKAVTLSRIKALQRRHNISRNTSPDNMQEKEGDLENANIETFEPYLINHEEHSITHNNEVLKLTNKEYELAVYLFSNVGALISRQQLLEIIWGTRAELNTRTVDTHVSRIRSKLGISPATGWQLSSIYQRGYRLTRVSSDHSIA